MIKAAFFDIDGTLLSFKTHRVSEGTVRAFRTLHNNGVRTFISSGRPMILIPEMPVSFDAYITMNGGLVFTSEGKVLLSNPIPHEDSESWLDFAKQHNLCTMVFTKDGMNHLGLYDPKAGTVSMGQKASKKIYPKVFKVHDGYAYSVFFDSGSNRGVINRVRID